MRVSATNCECTSGFWRLCPITSIGLCLRNPLEDFRPETPYPTSKSKPWLRYWLTPPVKSHVTHQMTVPDSRQPLICEYILLVVYGTSAANFCLLHTMSLSENLSQLCHGVFMRAINVRCEMYNITTNNMRCYRQKEQSLINIVSIAYKCQSLITIKLNWTQNASNGLSKLPCAST